MRRILDLRHLSSKHINYSLVLGVGKAYNKYSIFKTISTLEKKKIQTGLEMSRVRIPNRILKRGLNDKVKSRLKVLVGVL